MPDAPALHLTAIDSHAHVFSRGLNLARQRRYAPSYDAPLGDYLGQLRPMVAAMAYWSSPASWVLTTATCSAPCRPRQGNCAGW